MAERGAAAGVIALVVAFLLAGCGGGDSSGATVSVYAVAQLCGPARAKLAAHGNDAGHYRVRLVCVKSVHRPPGGGWDLAAAGADARRATEDTSAVAFLEMTTPMSKFSHSILAAAGIGALRTGSGREGMSKVIEALEGAGSSDVRGSVREALEPS